MSQPSIDSSRHLVTVGRLEATLDGSALRWIRLDGVEVLRCIDLTVREPDWGTVLPHIQSVVETADRSSVTISIGASYRASGIELDAVCRIALDASTVTYRVEYEVPSEARLNRIGVIVLHPMSVAGRRLVVDHPGGSEEIGFPVAIDPNIVATDIVGLGWRPITGVHGRVEFEGDDWEMEDQRNWTDASFKSYPRPLRLPFPFTLAAGTRGTCAVHASFEGSPRSSRRAPAVALDLPDRTVARLPSLGTEVRSFPLLREHLGVGHALRLGHLRVGVDAQGDEVGSALERLAQVKAVGFPFEVDVVTNPGSGSLPGIVDALRDSACVGVNVFSAKSPSALDSDSDAVASWASLASSAGLRAPIGAGTRANFTELNRTHPPAQADIVTYGVNPQVHAFDGESILETVGTIAAITRQASKISARRPLSVVVSGWPRPADVLAPCKHDPRFLEPLGTAWLTGMLASMSAPTVSRLSLLTLDELASAWRADSATARLIASLSELEDPRLLVAPAPMDVAILAIRHHHGYRILVANLRLEPSSARVRLPIDGPWSMRSLTAAGSKTRALNVPANREVTIRLDEVEVQRLDRGEQNSCRKGVASELQAARRRGERMLPVRHLTTTARHEHWVAGFEAELLAAGCRSAAYVGFLGTGGDDALHAAYSPATLARLADVKRRYDPGNLFRSNLNVRPGLGDAPG